MNNRSSHQPVTRRRLLQLAGSTGIAGLAGCSAVSSSPKDESPSPSTSTTPPSGPPDTTERLTPTAGSVDLASSESDES